MSHKFICQFRKLSIYIGAPTAHPFSRRPAGADSKTDPCRSGIVRKNRRKTRHEEPAHCHGHFGICDLHNSGAHGPGPSGACQEPDVRTGRITEESYGLVRILWLFRFAPDSGAGRGPLEARCTGQRLLQDGRGREGHGRLVPILWVLAPLDGWVQERRGQGCVAPSLADRFRPCRPPWWARTKRGRTRFAPLVILSSAGFLIEPQVVICARRRRSVALL